MKKTLESLGRMQLQALLVLLAVFVIGGLVGAALERAGRPRREPPPRTGMPPHLREELDLTAEQNRLIDGILADYRPRTEELFDRFMPDVRDLTEQMRGEIRAVLTPAQQEVFDRREPPPNDREPPPDDREPPPHDRGPPREGRRPPPPPDGPADR